MKRAAILPIEYVYDETYDSGEWVFHDVVFCEDFGSFRKGDQYDVVYFDPEHGCVVQYNGEKKRHSVSVRLVPVT